MGFFEISDLSMTFGGLTALEGISLQIEKVKFLP